MTVSDNTQPIYLGYSPSSDTYSCRYWPGDIDEFRIYNRALGTNEVLELAGNTVVHVTLGVSSLHGLPNPSVGVQTLVRKTAVTATVDAEIPVEEGTRYVCTGWIGSGSVPVSGTANRVDFGITNDSTLVWGWRTEHLLAASVSGLGSVAGGGWYEAGDTVKLVATPSTGHQFSAWNDGDPSAIRSVVVPEGGASYAATFTPIPRGILSFHKTAFSVTENNELGLVALKVERLGGSYGAATVTFTVDPGTATSGNDYFVEPCTATWDSGQTGPRYLVIDLADDALSEGNETFTVRLVDATGASVGEPHEAGVTIVDNEGARAHAWWMIWPLVRSHKTAR